MRARPHRFLQYLEVLSKTDRWHELPAPAGHIAGQRRSISTVHVELPGRVLRGIQQGFRLVLKTLARALYLSPLLIVVKLLLQFFDVAGADYVTVAFVVLVVCFFAMLSVHILWAVIVHAFGRGDLDVLLPFTSSGRDRGGVFSDVKVTVRGTIACVDGALPQSPDLVLRDMWAVAGAAPWRLTEVMDFAVVSAGDEKPHVIHCQTAPMVIAGPEPVTAAEGVARMSPGMTAIFDTKPALAGGRSAEAAQLLSLYEGDEVEVHGVVRGGIDNVQRFTLGDRVCSLGSSDRQGLSPYRGAAADPGILVVATPDSPLWIRKV